MANRELTPAFALGVAAAAGDVWGADRVAVGRDPRTTGAMLADAAAAGLQSVGCGVDRLGVVPTPALQAYCETAGMPGVMVTASHNPPEYNGIKLVGADGVELPVDALERVEDAFVADDVAAVTWDEVGSGRRVEDANAEYVAGVLDAIDEAVRERIAAADLTVALDPGNGAGSLTSPDVLRELGCHVVTVNASPDGRFPGRDPEPVEANLESLSQLVRAADADVGVAHDGDADRAIFLDAEGGYVEGDATLAALAADALDGGDVAVSAVNVSQRLVDAAADAGARVELTPIGSTRIMARIRELEGQGEHVPIAGEGNGGIVFPAYRLARDGAYTAARFLALVAGRSVAEVVAPFDAYHNVRTNIRYADEAARDALVEAAARYAEDADAEVTTTDGFRLDYGDAWVLARPSGTEPLVRVYAEARDESRARALADEMRGALEDAVADA